VSFFEQIMMMNLQSGFEKIQQKGRLKEELDYELFGGLYWFVLRKNVHLAFD
jgi:hypothetical protein